MFNFKNIALVAGLTPPAEPYRLAAQNVPIKGVVVDNANSTIAVFVYQGVSPTGTPIVVLPGWSRSFPIDGTNAIYVIFSGVPTSAGNIVIAWSDQPEAAFSTNVLTNITTPISIESLPNVTLASPQSIYSASDYPQNATLWEASGSTGSSSPFAIDTLTGLQAGQVIWLTVAIFTATALSAWNLAASNQTPPSASFFGGAGPVLIQLVRPWRLATVLATGTSTLTLTYTSSAPIGYYNFAGYVL